MTDQQRMGSEDEEVAVPALTIVATNDLSMLGGDGFVHMREQDAELLESIVLLNNDSMPSNVSRTRSSRSIGGHLFAGELSGKVGDVYEVPSTPLENHCIDLVSETLEETMCSPVGGIVIPEDSNLDENIASIPQTPRRSHHRPRTSATTLTFMPNASIADTIAQYSRICTEGNLAPRQDNSIDAKNENSFVSIPLRPMRRALSGEVWTSSENFNFNEGNIFDNTLTKTLSSNSRLETTNVVDDVSNACEPRKYLLGEPSRINGFIRRTESTERRMCEAAQFAEAVGEKDTVIPIIIDENDRNIYDEDDDEDTETPHHRSMINDDKPAENKLFHQENKVDDDDGTLAFLSLRPRRIDPTERRISEAVQFAEAVGEFHLGEDISTSIRIIDDDENDERFDDDEEDEKLYNNSNLNHNSTHKTKSSEECNNNQNQIYGNNRLLTPEFIHSHHTEPSTTVIAAISAQFPSHSELKIDSHFLDDSLRGFVRDTTGSIGPCSAQKDRGTGTVRNRGASFLDKLPDNYNSAPETSKQLDFVYKGIQSNPPEIVKRGIQRGNYAQLHRKAWLEVSDKYHRYGKNLRLYYRYWEKLGYPTNMFFDWLDSKGEAAGQPLPELEDCPRSKLDSDTVLYITNPEITQSYKTTFVPISVSTDNTTNPAVANTSDSTPVTQFQQNSQGLPQHQHLRRGLVLDARNVPIRTGPDGWIFVLRDSEMYGAPKVTASGGHSGSSVVCGRNVQQRFHHSSFFGGKAVAAAGIFITDDDGILTRLYPHSGHYRPGEAHMQRVLFHLYHKGIDLRTFDMDIQQILHIARGVSDNDNIKIKSNQVRNQPDITDERMQVGSVKVKKASLDVDVTIPTPSELDLIPSNYTPTSPSVDDKEKKKKKTESLHLMPAILVACFLAHKARFIGEGIFAQIHKIRKHGADITSVTEALNVIDDGGCFWSAGPTPMSRTTTPTSPPTTMTNAVVPSSTINCNCNSNSNSNSSRDGCSSHNNYVVSAMPAISFKETAASTSTGTVTSGTITAAITFGSTCTCTNVNIHSKNANDADREDHVCVT